MSSSLARWLPSWGAMVVLAGAVAVTPPVSAKAAPIPAHHPQGTAHGYLVMRSESGEVLASGDLIQVVSGSRVTAHVVFHFKDGSLDDETTVFTQRGGFHLISDHHVQKGPFFSHPMDMWVDVPKGEATVQSAGKDGEDESHAEKMKMPSDLCSPPMLIPIAENLTASGGQVSLIVATPKPRLVKLAFSALGKDKFSVAGSEREAQRFQAKFDLKGLAGIVAPMVGKQPPDIDIWIEPGEVPAFVKEQSQLAEDGPVVSIQQIGPVGPANAESGSSK